MKHVPGSCSTRSSRTQKSPLRYLRGLGADRSGENHSTRYRGTQVSESRNRRRWEWRKGKGGKDDEGKGGTGGKYYVKGKGGKGGKVETGKGDKGRKK